MSLADLMPKVDISGQIKADLIKELGDKNWKIRGEALQKIQDIIAQAKFVQPSLGELPGALKGRLGDSNKNLVRDRKRLHMKKSLLFLLLIFTYLNLACLNYSLIIPNSIHVYMLQ